MYDTIMASLPHSSMSTMTARLISSWPMIQHPTISTSIMAMAHSKTRASISGFALNQEARETSSMGLAVGDYLNNGLVDLYTTTFSDDYKSLFRNEGGGNFSEITAKDGHRPGNLSFPELGH